MKPTIGRIVHWKSPWTPEELYPAIITKVWSDTCVNLYVFADSKGLLIKTSVVQGDLPEQWSWPIISKS